jgi:hypothetical protein
VSYPVDRIGLHVRPKRSMLEFSLDRAWPLDRSPCFGALLQAIDEAEGELTDGSAGRHLETVEE